MQTRCSRPCRPSPPRSRQTKQPSTSGALVLSQEQHACVICIGAQRIALYMDGVQ